MIIHKENTPLALEGRIDAHSAPELRRFFESLLAAEESIHVDVSEVNFIDSSGLAALVSALKSSRLKGTDFCLLNPSEAVSTILNYTMLDQVIPSRMTERVAT